MAHPDISAPIAAASLDQLRAQAVEQHGKGALASAEQLYRRLLSQRPLDFQALLSLGVLVAQSGKMQEAADILRRAVAVQPGAALAHDYLGLVLDQLGLRDQALDSYDVAIRLQPGLLSARINRATSLREQGRYRDALAAGDAWIALEPQSAHAYFHQGQCHQQLGEFESALVAYARVLLAAPAHGPALVHAAAALIELGRAEEAVVVAERATVLVPPIPGAWVNRGIALQALGRFEAALLSCERALSIDPKDLSAHYNRANALLELRRFGEALEGFDACIALQPQNAEIHFRRAVALLLCGDFARGWPAYEWRSRRGPSFPARMLSLSVPRWEGQELAGKTLLLHWEQGYGDTIQFCRYAKRAAERGATVILEVQKPLHRLLGSLDGTVSVVSDLGDAHTADYHCPLLSLPHRLGITRETPATPMPYLRPDATRVANWRRRIGTHGYKIGICWQGSPGKVDIGRSFPLAALQPIAALPAVRLVSLQKHVGVEQLAALPAQMRVETLGDDWDDGADAFVDSAAVLQHLDLVITVDTALAHLAGALHRPTWLALQYTPDWRWGFEGNDTPWYPSLRLFRQSRPGQWQGVFTEMLAQLRIRLPQADR